MTRRHIRDLLFCSHASTWPSDVYESIRNPSTRNSPSIMTRPKVTVELEGIARAVSYGQCLPMAG